jgi:hypothetical protein
MKPRKNNKRWKGSYDLCPDCYSINCDPMMDMKGSPWEKKKEYRLHNELCVSCGKNPCGCKRRKYKSNIEK